MSPFPTPVIWPHWHMVTPYISLIWWHSPPIFCVGNLLINTTNWAKQLDCQHIFCGFNSTNGCWVSSYLSFLKTYADTNLTCVVNIFKPYAVTNMTWHRQIVIIAMLSADTDLTCDHYLTNMVSPSAGTDLTWDQKLVKSWHHQLYIYIYIYVPFIIF